MLKCSDDQPYTGCAVNLKERFKRHQHGRVISTKRRLPVSLQVAVAFPNRYVAYAFEKYLKSGSGRAFALKHLTPKN